MLEFINVSKLIKSIMLPQSTKLQSNCNHITLLQCNALQRRVPSIMEEWLLGFGTGYLSGIYHQLVSCHPQGNSSLDAVSSPVWTSSQCSRLPLPWLVEEAWGHVADGLSSAVLKRTAQLDSKMWVYGGKLSAINLLRLVNLSWTRAARWKLTLTQMTTNLDCSCPSHHVYL